MLATQQLVSLAATEVAYSFADDGLQFAVQKV
jgi:hypothetical protein